MQTALGWTKSTSRAAASKAGKKFFSEEKNQKTFMPRALSNGTSCKEAKVFCFFFSKKKSFLPNSP
jgi:hypothetical protein